ncbi:gamma-butyrobetaine hydroxylase-like domain-containing protein [Bradyrhizobium sp. SZCCHNPS2010]|uniref:gamma-butyrobetaine hydroxylase-like domain-containing protein n=1 Tax=Bradyrhizobium sp. SZCCHNPS2010 TaxID=3057333 RepID=UPI002916AB61|nr:gamma-butyrobetaine hydroxylase-like domain-containing protein [Bradyrhizobium sp. SZCCHNPS2010]
MSLKPERIEVVDEARALALTWFDGQARIDTVTLRRASRAASELRRQIDGIALVVPDDLHLTGLQPIGNYAVRLSFSDGHDRGIYPWSYLRELAEQSSADRSDRRHSWTTSPTA